MEKWHIIRSRPHVERWLISSLDGLGVTTLYPRIWRQRRGKLVFEPLFPGYVFSRFDPETSNWPAIRWAPGLSCFLGAGERPASVSDDLVGSIVSFVASHNDSIVAGGLVEYLQDDSSSVEAVLGDIVRSNTSSKMRIRSLFKLVGKLSPVEVAAT